MRVTAPLHALLDAAARSRPDHPALEETDGEALSYRALDELSARARDRLVRLGVRPGDRVGLFLRKSIDAVACCYGVLRSGAAYVPADPAAPATRAAGIFADCQVRAVVVEASLEAALRAACENASFRPAFLVLPEAHGGRGLDAALGREELGDPAPVVRDGSCAPGDLAYVLYTSGSTGRPKGVMLTHEAAQSFVDWCSDTFTPRPEDRFASHAPLHFDLSILDLYLCCKHGGTLVIIGEALGKDPPRLAATIAERRISVWYSAPSVLSLLCRFGHLERQGASAPRLVLFAGEVFPVKHLRALTLLWPGARYFNLYGPTETNVCTSYEVSLPVPAERTEPYPIGTTCTHLRTRVIDGSGADVPDGHEGELVVSGPGVMQGYWNLPDANDRAFLRDADGSAWYRTGDFVVREVDGAHRFVGRRDRMVKRRGHRVELGEIEAGLHRHAAIERAAVLALPDEENGVSIRAFVACFGDRPSIVALKRFCAENLPPAMIPDLFRFLPALPETSTGKVDYRALERIAGDSPSSTRGVFPPVGGGKP